MSETGSTNADLLGRAEADSLVDRTVLVAGRQIAGRGRRNRTWVSPDESDANLFASFGFTEVPDDPGELMRRCSLAYVDAARSFGVSAELKWPNDLVVGEAKLAGILAQRSSTGAVVVGIGLNIGWAPPGAARLGDVPTWRALDAVLRAFDALPVNIHDRYVSALSTLGREVRVELQHSELIGRAVDVQTDGRLIVVDDQGVTHVVDVGDVVHLRGRGSG